MSSFFFMSENPNQGKGDSSKIKVTVKAIRPFIATSNILSTCCICRCELDEICNKCRENKVIDKKECPTVTGKCGHTFHQHCISEWLKHQRICPYACCGTEWEVE